MTSRVCLTFRSRSIGNFVRGINFCHIPEWIFTHKPEIDIFKMTAKISTQIGTIDFYGFRFSL